MAVACRAALMVRPLLEREAGSHEALHRVGDTHIAFEKREYGPFDAVPLDTNALFAQCVQRDLLDNVMKGFNATILAYGQTGSGKTFTMGSGGGALEHPGLIQLAVRDLFERLPEGSRVKVTFIQVYNEQVYDLLASEQEDDQLTVRMDERGSFTAKGARALPCGAAEDAFGALRRGVQSRKTAETRMNAHSSRSHALLTLQLEIPAGGATLTPKVHFVDLAGSERTRRAETSGLRLREGININLSLSCLGHVIDALARKTDHVPYRNSNLTMLLHDSLGGNSQTLMVACVSPAASEGAEAKSTLDYASRVRQITNRLCIERSQSSRSADGSASERSEPVLVVVNHTTQAQAEEAQAEAEQAKAQAEEALAAAEEAHAAARDAEARALAAEAAAEQERAAHSSRQLSLEESVASLAAQLAAAEQRAEAEGGASRELRRVRGLLLALEQRLRQREADLTAQHGALAAAEASLAAAHAELGLAVQGRDAVASALSLVQVQLAEAQRALEAAREECAECRRQLAEAGGASPMDAVEDAALMDVASDIAEAHDSAEVALEPNLGGGFGLGLGGRTPAPGAEPAATDVDDEGPARDDGLGTSPALPLPSPPSMPPSVPPPPSPSMPPSVPPSMPPSVPAAASLPLSPRAAAATNRPDARSNAFKRPAVAEGAVSLAEIKSTLEGAGAVAAFKATDRSKGGPFQTTGSTELGGGQKRWPPSPPQGSKRSKK